jgi:multiple sugar transport system permease protein
MGPLLASPWLVGAIIFTGGPLLYSLLLGFCAYDVQHEPRWIGLGNFREIVHEDSVAHRASLNTLFMMLSIPASLAVSLSLAILLNSAMRFRGFWQSLFYMPVIVPMVASALAWIWVFNAQGPINQLLIQLGLPGPNWLHDPAWSKPALLIMCVWTCGGSMVVWLAGLQAVPKALYEAAALDGANALQRFAHVTLPHLHPYLLFNLLAGLIAVFQYFGESFVMTEGGPDGSTLFVNYHLLNLAFRFGRLGYASALAWMMFVALAALSITQFRVARKWRKAA